MTDTVCETMAYLVCVCGDSGLVLGCCHNCKFNKKKK
jgi:hypothetical protein